MIPDSLQELILKSRPEEPESSFAYSPNDSDLEALERVGRSVLENVPYVPGACAIMSALYCARVQASTKAPAFVAAGALALGREGSTVFFGGEKGFDGQAVFSRSDLSWDGHCWVMLGDFIADVSLFRTAYSLESPPALAQHVSNQFGQGRGLLICRAQDAAENLGLHYRPQYILTEQQITNLLLGGEKLFA